MSRKPNRSDKYQYKYAEIQVSDEFMNLYTNEENAHLDNVRHSEEYIELNNAATALIIDIMTNDKQFTKNQRTVSKMKASGMTQAEIATELGCNQSSVVKTLLGNVDYSDGKRVMYGGVAKKLKRVLKESEKFRTIIKKLYEMEE